MCVCLNETKLFYCLISRTAVGLEQADRYVGVSVETAAIFELQ